MNKDKKIEEKVREFDCKKILKTAITEISKIYIDGASQWALTEKSLLVNEIEKQDQIVTKTYWGFVKSDFDDIEIFANAVRQWFRLWRKLIKQYNAVGCPKF